MFLKKNIAILFLFVFSFFLTQKVNASLGGDLSGLILLNVEENGEAWYVYPEDSKRYFLGRPDDAFQIMRELGLGIKEIDFQKIAQAGMDVEGDLVLARRLAGKIIIQVEKNGEAWYIYPKDFKKYYLGRPKDAFKVMRELSLGITRENLAKIHKPSLNESIDEYSKYEHTRIKTVNDNFAVDIVEIDLKNPSLEIITDASEDNNCESNCKAESLASFVLKNEGFAGINGTYFEAYNLNKENYYYFPLYKSNNDVLINQDKLKYWTTGPMFVWDDDNKFYYFKDSREFKSIADFEKNYSTKISAAIGNKPRLIEDYMNLLIEFDIDEKQRNVKSIRNAIGYKDDKIYLVIAKNATVPDLADILKEMKIEYALNLDGGYSSALWYNDEYMVMPGRDVPNAIVFRSKK